MYADGRIEWTTGDWSGGRDGLAGTEALAGINAGDQTNHITIPGSQTPEIINITSTSNIGIPGTWIFKVGGVAIPDVTVETSDEQLIGESLVLECRIGPADDIYINSTFDIIWTKESANEVKRVEKISGRLLSNYSDYYKIQTLRAGDAYTSYRCDVIINFTRPLNTSVSFTLENVTQPPQIIINPLQSPLKVSVGGHLPLYCTAVTGFPIPEVQWHSEGFPVYPTPQAYQQMYLVPTNSPHETTYTCVCTYKQGVNVSSELRINVTVIVHEPCPSLKKPKNGEMMMTEDKQLAYFSCNRGYTMRGSTVTKCKDGKWNYFPPTCHAISNYCRQKCEF